MRRKVLTRFLKIRNTAVAALAWFEAAKMGHEMVNDAQEIKIRAERKAREFLKTMPKRSGGGDHLSPAVTTASTNVPTLDDLGVHRMQSSRWQKN